MNTKLFEQTNKVKLNEERKYSFNLEWEELPADLRKQKIEEYLETNDLDYISHSGKNNAEEAEETIKRHFPIYF